LIFDDDGENVIFINAIKNDIGTDDGLPEGEGSRGFTASGRFEIDEGDGAVVAEFGDLGGVLGFVHGPR
jgi:hypothetical protein